MKPAALALLTALAGSVVCWLAPKGARWLMRRRARRDAYIGPSSRYDTAAFRGSERQDR